ncbi:MAG: NUDIX hydrolase [Brachybacterium sp.]|nr:NUDIX hydrolase [Brachybacterium sp.]
MTRPVLRRLVSAVPPVLRRAVVGRVVLWTQPRFLIGVCSVLTAPDGRILLLEHRFWNGGKWGVPSGHMGHRESPQRTATRELLEETGLRPRDLRIARVVTGLEHRVEIWMRGMIDIDEAPPREDLQQREITDARLLPLPEALRVMRPGQAEVVRAVLAEDSPGAIASGRPGRV